MEGQRPIADQGGEREEGRGEIQGVFCFLHMRRNPWVQGDHRKLYVPRGENKGDINETAIPGRYRFVFER